MKNFKPSKELMVYTKKLLIIFIGKYSLGRYSIKVAWVDKIPAGRKGKEYADGCTAEIEIDSRYFDIKITFSKKWAQKFREKDYDTMTQDMCHELAHVLTDPYHEFFWEYIPRSVKKTLTIINEQQTQLLANAVMTGVRPEEYLP